MAGDEKRAVDTRTDIFESSMRRKTANSLGSPQQKLGATIELFGGAVVSAGVEVAGPGCSGGAERLLVCVRADVAVGQASVFHAAGFVLVVHTVHHTAQPKRARHTHGPDSDLKVRERRELGLARGAARVHQQRCRQLTSGGGVANCLPAT
eukprot:6213045-Pleurochrysis_carterae.AAC.6